MTASAEKMKRRLKPMNTENAMNRTRREILRIKKWQLKFRGIIKRKIVLENSKTHITY